MAIIKNIETAKRYVKLSFSSSSPMLPDFDMAEELILKPLLGDDLFDAIQADAVATEPGQPVLLDKCRKAIAPYAYALSLPSIQVQLSDAGLHSVQDETRRSAFRWEHEKIQEQLYTQAAFHLDALIQYLFKEAEALAWSAPSHISTIFKTGAEFSQYFPLFQPFRVFEQLRPLAVAELREQVYTAIGEAFATDLLSKANPSDDEKAAINLIKFCLAYSTIRRSVESLNVAITAQGFSVLLGTAINSDAATNGRQQADANSLSTLRNSVQQTADQFKQDLLQLLNSKASAEKFTIFFNSTFYKKPGASIPDANASRKGVFGL